MYNYIYVYMYLQDPIAVLYAIMSSVRCSMESGRGWVIGKFRFIFINVSLHDRIRAHQLEGRESRGNGATASERLGAFLLRSFMLLNWP